MTDREKITAIVESFCERWEERPHSLTIHDSRTRILFLPDGRIKSIVRNGKDYPGPREEIA